MPDRRRIAVVATPLSGRLARRLALLLLLVLPTLLFPLHRVDGQQAPAAPSGLTAAPGDSRAVTLSWDDPNDPTITAYELRRTAGGKTTDWFQFGSHATTHVSANIEYGVQYTFELRAIRGQTAGAVATVTVAARPAPGSPSSPAPGGGSGGGGGGVTGGPRPGLADYEWTMVHDIETPRAGRGEPSGMWSDGATLWIAQRGAGAGAAISAYDLGSGERIEDREVALDERNRDPRGLASDGETLWVSDGARGRLFAYALASGDRRAARDLPLGGGNSDARGIWLSASVVWVLDGARDALFAYDHAGGDPVGAYALAAANRDPRGLWSDGVTVWVADPGARRLFAYRLPALPAAAADPAEENGERAAPAGLIPLERAGEEDFRRLSRAGNHRPRGIWSDGGLMYVADASDDRVYTYNMPDAIDARLASLTLRDVEFGEFAPYRTEYAGAPAEGVTATIVAAAAMQRGATVDILPPDADGAAAGHQVALEGLDEISVTVTSADGNRQRVYRVRFAPPPWPHCLLGEVAAGFRLVVYEGGGVEHLAACAASRGVAALYALRDGAYVAYIPGAPAIVNQAFRELFPGGVPAATALVARGEGPPSADPAGGAGVAPAWPECLRGAVGPGFSAVVYAGGHVEDLAACARERDVTAIYVLHVGGWVSYIPDAPAFVNRAFRELFPDGVPALTPLIVKREE